MLIGLTGGLGCGKTTVLRMFAELGCPTLSSDAVVDRLLTTSPIREKLKQALGPGILGSNGQVSKSSVAARVFSFPQDLKMLEDVLHPRVLEAILHFGREHAGRVAVAEVPLLFEKRIERHFARTVCAACSEEKAIGRYTLARSVFTHEARARMALQLPVEEKKRRADFIIDTEGDLESVHRQVRALYGRLALMAQQLNRTEPAK